MATAVAQSFRVDPAVRLGLCTQEGVAPLNSGKVRGRLLDAGALQGYEGKRCKCGVARIAKGARGILLLTQPGGAETYGPFDFQTKRVVCLGLPCNGPRLDGIPSSGAACRQEQRRADTGCKAVEDEKLEKARAMGPEA